MNRCAYCGRRLWPWTYQSEITYSTFEEDIGKIFHADKCSDKYHEEHLKKRRIREAMRNVKEE